MALIDTVTTFGAKVWKPIRTVTEALATATDTALDLKSYISTVNAETDDFTALGDSTYIISIAAKASTLPASAGGEIRITNSSVGDHTVGSLGTLSTGATCILYWDGSNYAELTAVLT